MSQQQFLHYEHGINRIDIDSLVMIAELLKLSIHYFLKVSSLREHVAGTMNVEKISSSEFSLIRKLEQTNYSN